MEQGFSGRSVLVSGGTGGLGRAVTLAFLAEGARVVATDLDMAKLGDLDRAVRRRLDVRSTAEVEALAKAVARDIGALDVLVNCAG